MPWNVVRITLDTLASTTFSLSKSSWFALRFFISSLSSYPLKLSGRRQNFRFRQIDRNSRAHRRRQGNPLDVLALGRGRFGFDHRIDDGVRVFRQLGRVKIN